MGVHICLNLTHRQSPRKKDLTKTAHLKHQTKKSRLYVAGSRNTTLLDRGADKATVDVCPPCPSASLFLCPGARRRTQASGNCSVPRSKTCLFKSLKPNIGANGSQSTGLQEFPESFASLRNLISTIRKFHQRISLCVPPRHGATGTARRLHLTQRLRDFPPIVYPH